MATQQFRGDLAGLALTDSAGDLLISAAAGRDVVIKLPDASGVRRVLIKDSLNAVVATITSDGFNTAEGAYVSAGPLALAADATPQNEGEIGRQSGVLGFFEAGSFQQLRHVCLINGANPLTMSGLNLVAGAGISLTRTEGPAGQMNVTISNDGAVSPEASNRAIDPVLDAVPGQPNTYYIDRGATTYGFNAALDTFGQPDVKLYINGRKKIQADEADLGHPTKPAEFAVVRSQATSGEGPAAAGSRNAVKLASPLVGYAWLDYRRLNQATA